MEKRKKDETYFKRIRNSFVKKVLRRASLAWKPRGEALKAARVSRGKYQCSVCENLFSRKEVQLDHIDPVADLEKRTDAAELDLNVYVEKLLTDVEGWDVKCKGCHSVKTELENKARVILIEIEETENEK